MNQRRTVVYAGGIGLPDRSAAALRVLENSRLLKALGYRVVIIGRLPDQQDRSPAHEATLEGFECHDIHSPVPGRSFPNYKRSAEGALSVVDAIGPGQIHAVIAYNYPARPLAQIIAYGRARGVKVVAECTEWRGWEGARLIDRIRQRIDSEWRMRLLAPRAGNIISASKRGVDFYRRSHCLALPFVIDETGPKWAPPAWPRSETGRRFVYAGSPGKGMSKDYVHRLVEAFARLAQEGLRFDLQFAGVTAAEVLEAFPRLRWAVEAIAPQSVFHGRMPHAEVVGLLKSADFSLLVRPYNRVSAFGFPTKLAEAFVCGAPPITNDTSDIADYVRDGEAGLLIEGAEVDDIASAVRRALAISDAEAQAMKDRCLASNPFAPSRFEGRLSAFLRDLR